jgi:hypothetical protein
MEHESYYRVSESLYTDLILCEVNLVNALLS